MILTVTMNPSVDIAYQVPGFRIDAVNRAVDVRKTCGGKGLNVTRVLKQCGEPVTATGLLGGELGDFVCRGLDELGIAYSFYPIKGETRNCIAILHDGRQTEILESGPLISDEEYDGFLDFYKKLVEKVDAVSISGSLPKGLPLDCYGKMIEIAKEFHVPVVLDCSGESLAKALPAKPTVIKPNMDELSGLLGYVGDLKEALNRDLFAGIEWVIVSLGAKGCFGKHGDRFYRVSIPRISVVNPVGSGDSTVAGIVSGLVNKLNDEDLLKRANTLGMLNAMEKETGMVNLDHYDELFHQIIVEEV